LKLLLDLCGVLSFLLGFHSTLLLHAFYGLFALKSHIPLSKVLFHLCLLLVVVFSLNIVSSQDFLLCGFRFEPLGLHFVKVGVVIGLLCASLLDSIVLSVKLLVFFLLSKELPEILLVLGNEFVSGKALELEALLLLGQLNFSSLVELLYLLLLLGLCIDPLVVASHFLFFFGAEVLMLTANLLRVVHWRASVLLKIVLPVHLLVPLLLCQELSQILFILCNQLISCVAFELKVGLFPEE